VTGRILWTNIARNPRCTILTIVSIGLSLFVLSTLMTVLTELNREPEGEDTHLRLVVRRATSLADRMDHHPRQLSGGQEQRVAIARALVTDPALLVADEPTGDLDAKSAHEVLEILNRLNRESGKTIIMATHDPRAAAVASVVRYLDKGLLLPR
jgi:putative ABC transport system ATP-binding protein